MAPFSTTEIALLKTAVSKLTMSQLLHLSLRSRALSPILLAALLMFPSLLWAQATYDPATKMATIPVVGVVDESGTLTGDYYTVKLRSTTDHSNFALVSAERTSPVPAADGSISPPDATFDDPQTPSYLTVDTVAVLNENTATKDYFYAVKITAGSDNSLSISGSLQTRPPAYTGNEALFTLRRGGANQFLLPVEIGNQTFNLLVDTGSNALLVFEDKIAPSNTRIKRQSRPISFTDENISKGYASVTREGFLAIAPVRIGAYSDEDMRIMVIQKPDSQNDPSLTAKGADGIIGLRRTEGLNFKMDRVLLDVPLATLKPAVNVFELNLPPVGVATLSFGKMPILDRADSAYLFRSKTLSVVDSFDPVNRSYSDLQVRFRAKSSYGEANDEHLDILLDTGAVSKLVLDTEVAKSLGYDPATKTWAIPEDEEIELNLVGPRETISLHPKFRVSEISVAPYSTMGVAFEGVLGISRWQSYVVGFSSVDFQSGGPDGTITMLHRPNFKHAVKDKTPSLSKDYVELPGLNSIGDDRFPAADQSGNTIVFQSNRPGSLGAWDIYVWQRDKGILELPGLNTAQDEADPAISGDGRYLVFHSNRDGGLGSYDIYLYDITDQQLIAIQANSAQLERNPHISRDGRYIAFRSERPDGVGGSDIYLYDRETEQRVELPGLNTEQNEYDPSVSENGLFITFHRDTAGSDNRGQKDVFVYSREEKRIVSTNQFQLVNTPYQEMASTISPDGDVIAFQSNRTNPQMGLHDRDIFVVHWPTEIPTKVLGLNSEFDEAAPSFSGDGEFMVFHSQRPGGQGGSDVYMYHKTEKPTSVSPNPLLQEETLPLTQTAGGLFTLSVLVGGQPLNLLVDTTLSAMVVFDDKISPALISKTREPVTLRVLGDKITGVAALADTLGVNNLRIVAANSQDYAKLVGHSLEGVDGIIGLHHARPAGYLESNATVDVPMLRVQPRISMMEFNFDPAGAAGLSVGSMPLIAGVSEHLLFDSYVEGQIDEEAPEQSFTDIAIPFVASSSAENGSRAEVGFDFEHEGIQLVLGTTLKDRVILDTGVAQKLGYDANSQSWNAVTEIDIYLWPYGSDTFVEAALGLPVEQVSVADLGDANYQAILGLDYWQKYILGFDTIDQQSGGPMGIVSLLRREDMAEQPPVIDDHHFISLPGLNSRADDAFGDISDDGQTLVFQSNRSGNLDIYVYRLGEGLLDLNWLNSPATEADPSLSSDGHWLAFHSNRSGRFEIYLYNISTQSLVDLPGLNSADAEVQNLDPALNADATQLAFRRDEPNEFGNGIDSNLYLYNIAEQRLVPLTVNTEAGESNPSLSGSNLLGFDGFERYDGQGGVGSVHLFDLNSNEIIDLPTSVNSPDFEGGSDITADGDFMAFHSNRNNPHLLHRGSDIFLLERRSQELLLLPGLNSPFTEGFPALSQGAKYILFHSKRAGGEGGYDLYLYERDKGDETPYEVTEAYWEDGYVVDEVSGVPITETTIKVIDADGNTVAEAVTDHEGDFKVKIPAGTKLPLRTETADGKGKVVVDEVGDDTYVPDFQLGNLKFTDVWVEDTAESGYPTTIRFDIETDAPKYNVWVEVFLVPYTGNASDLDLSGEKPLEKIAQESSGQVHVFTALSIDKLGHNGEEKAPIVQTQTVGGRVTTITYEPGSGNKKAHVEHSFEVPKIEKGTYVAVFALNRADYAPQDDALQGEETGDLADNYLVAPASIIIGNPDKPNLRILFAELVNNSFVLPKQAEQKSENGEIPDVRDELETPDEVEIPEDEQAPLEVLTDAPLKLNMEVESMGLDTVEPVDITFELAFDGVSYPLSFLHQDEAGNLIKAPKMTYHKECRQPENAEGFTAGEHCASLFRQEKRGHTYALYIDEAASEELLKKQSDTTVELIVKVDPDNKITEWENNTSDNVKHFSVRYLVPQQNERQVRAKQTYPSVIFNAKKEDTWGNSYFAAGYEFGPQMTYRPLSIGGVTLPIAVNIDFSNELWAKVFGTKNTLLALGIGLNFDIDDLLRSGPYGQVTILNNAVMAIDGLSSFLNATCNRACQGCQQACTMSSGLETQCKKLCKTRTGTIWSTVDKSTDREKYRKEKKFFDKSKTFIVPVVSIPVLVTVTVIGEVGPKAAIKIEANNKLVFEGGIYASLKGRLEAGPGAGTTGAHVSAGAGVELTFIDLSLTLKPSFQFLPSYPVAYIDFKIPIALKSLSGRLYLYAGVTMLDIINKKYELNLFKWDGFTLLDVNVLNFGRSIGYNQFDVYNYTGCFDFNCQVSSSSRISPRQAAGYAWQEIAYNWPNTTSKVAVKMEGYLPFTADGILFITGKYQFQVKAGHNKLVRNNEAYNDCIVLLNAPEEIKQVLEEEGEFVPYTRSDCDQIAPWVSQFFGTGQIKVELYKEGIKDDAHKIVLFSNSSTADRTMTTDIPGGMHKVVITYTPQSVPEDTYGIRFWWKKGSY